MAKKLLSIVVQGDKQKWGFHFYGDPKHLPLWLKDGLEIKPIDNVIPFWVASFNLVRPWLFLQDLFNFKNPFNNKHRTFFLELPYKDAE